MHTHIHTRTRTHSYITTHHLDQKKVITRLFEINGDGDGFLLLYSITSWSTFQNVERYRDQLFSRKGINAQVPLILVGNKCDMEKGRVVRRWIEGRELAKGFHCKFTERSAKNNIKVEQAFHAIVREVRYSRTELLDRKKNKKNKKNKKKKCVIL